MRALAIVLGLLLWGCTSGLAKADLAGRYRGRWDSDERGVLELKADGTYAWTPTDGSARSQPRRGRFDLEYDLGWNVVLKSENLEDPNKNATWNCDVNILLSRIRTISCGAESGYILTRE